MDELPRNRQWACELAENFWLSANSSGYPDVDFAGYQIGNSDEIAQRAVAACLSLGGLHETIDALDQAVGDVAVEPGEDAVAVLLYGARYLLDRFEVATGSPSCTQRSRNWAPQSQFGCL